jgi:hypothetical protein
MAFKLTLLFLLLSDCAEACGCDDTSCPSNEPVAQWTGSCDSSCCTSDGNDQEKTHTPCSGNSCPGSCPYSSFSGDRSACFCCKSSSPGGGGGGGGGGASGGGSGSSSAPIIGSIVALVLALALLGYYYRTYRQPTDDKAKPLLGHDSLNEAPYIGVVMKALPNKPKVFISWRMSESKAEVALLTKALEALGVEVIVIGELPGGNLLRAVSQGMTKADMFVIMGTKTYGTTTSGLIDTNKEMQHITPCAQKGPKKTLHRIFFS